jgi:hypothetical protein
VEADPYSVRSDDEDAVELPAALMAALTGIVLITIIFVMEPAGTLAALVVLFRSGLPSC